ncbi:MAG: hypothetical protein PHT46_00115 [Candidatus Marinimicrobia bacterium]|nr:hypothetical protein [Candidatus Neomarinimicrobiota bacterium]MDD5708949.1 hypothetical protein [Candidatus Neomarinimicrobiota bacterium]MDX9778060.1 hypothetical protein [bacterium]
MKKSKRIRDIVILHLVCAMTLTAQDLFEADIYLLGSNKEVKLFTHKNSEEIQNGERVWTQYYYQPDGTLFATDQLILDREANWHTHKTAFPLLKEFSVMERKGENLAFFYSRDGKSKSKDRKIEQPVVFGPTQQRFLYENIDRIAKGEELMIFTPAPEFLRLIEFKVRRIEGSEYERPGHMVVEMGTQNPIISWFLGKSFYVVDLDSKLIMEIHGASILKREVKGKWEYVNVDMYFRYPEKASD